MEIARPENIFQIFVALTLLGAAISDLRTFRIPNAFPTFIMVLFIGYVILAATGVLPAEVNVIGHVTSFALAFLLGLIAFRYRVMAGGDVKLIAATALWVSLDQLHILLALIALAGGLQAAAVVLFHYASHCLRSLHAVVSSASESESIGYGPGLTGRRIPYGIAIAGGSIAAFLLALC